MASQISAALQAAITDMSENPFGVRNPDGAAFLVQPMATTMPPATFVAMACGAATKTALNIMGGCSDMDGDDKRRMLDFFGEAFEGIFDGAVFSGATRDVLPGENPGEFLLDPMITDVPTLIARINKGVVALGSVPKVIDVMKFLPGRGLQVSPYGAFVNTDYDAIVVVQNGIEEKGEWDHDLQLRRNTLNLLRDRSRFRVGGIGWNGGGVTLKELIGTVQSGDPLILCKGSKRKCDELVGQFEAGEFKVFGLKDDAKPANVLIADSRKPMTLRTLLLDSGLAQKSAA